MGPRSNCLQRSNLYFFQSRYIFYIFKFFIILANVHFWKLGILKLHGTQDYLEWLKCKQLILHGMHCTNFIFMYKQCSNAKFIDSNSWKHIRRISKYKKWTILRLAYRSNSREWMEWLLWYICMQLCSDSCIFSSINFVFLDYSIRRTWCIKKLKSLYVFIIIYTTFSHILDYVCCFKYCHGLIFISKLFRNTL